MATKAKAKKKSQTPTQPLKATAQKQTKTQILRTISEVTGLSGRDVKSVFLATNHLAQSHLIRRGSGEFTIPEMGIKILRKTKPATKKKMGRNPLTGESIVIAAKPKREVIKVRPLKALKSLLDN